ncbi:MAG: cell envelope integrity protein TolA [Caldimonas sp.]
MTAAALPRDAFAPQPPAGMRTGFGLAFAVHVLLVIALAWSVHWKSSDPEGVVAELWSAVPQIAAPRAVAPEPRPLPTPPQPVPAPQPTPRVVPPEPRPAPPPPPKPEPAVAPRQDAQIAIERAALEKERRLDAERADAARKAERKAELTRRDEARRLEDEKQARLQKQRLADEQVDKKKLAEKARLAEAKAEALAKAKAEAKAEAAADAKADAKQAAIREANLRRLKSLAGNGEESGTTGTAARTSGPSAGYAGRIKARIKPNIVLTGEVSGNPTCEVEVRVAPDGTIVGRKITKSSGSGLWDQTVLRAIDKTEVLPRDTDGRVPPVFTMTFRPLE